MADLGRRRGYTLVAVDAAGVNAFFVRQDILECQKEQVGGCVVVVVVEVVVVCVCVCAGGGGVVQPATPRPCHLSSSLAALPRRQAEPAARARAAFMLQAQHMPCRYATPNRPIPSPSLVHGCSRCL